METLNQTTSGAAGRHLPPEWRGVPEAAEWAPVRDLPRGEYIKLSDKPAAKVWKLGAYDRSARAYWATDCGDLSHGKLLKGARLVVVGFTY